MTRMPPHIEMTIRKNPNAVLTERGVVLKRTDRVDELLVGIPNADKLYGDHFDEIKTEQAENLASVAVKVTTESNLDDVNRTPEDKNEPTPEDKVQEVQTESTSGQIFTPEDTPEVKIAEPTAFDVAFAEAKVNPKYKDLSDAEITKRVQMSIAAKERAAKKKAEDEASK